MSNIDERIVAMKFNASQFGQGVKTTLGLLDNLKLKLNMGGATKGLDELGAGADRLSKHMKLEGATKGIENIDAAAKHVSLANISSAVDGISSKFSAMSVIGIAALGTLASKAASVGINMAKSLSVEPITDGFSDYELKIGATQNIMSGTGENIATVTSNLKDLDIYADKTIYNLRDMTSNIGKFTNAGVKLPVAVSAMKGIGNVAALSGANTEEASRAMYNLGQAIGQGSVKLMDWKSVELANMGTMEFKQQLIDSAVAMGTLKKGSDGVLKTTKGTIVTTKNFSTTLADQWLTSEALTKTLENYSSETTEIGKKAWKAASEVKSFSMMTTTLKASMGTGWTDTFDILVGDLPEATKMWTDTTNAISKIINASADSRNKLFGDWDKDGGRKAIIAGVTNAFHALMAIIQPIKDAFHNIFPPATGKDLANLSRMFEKFTKGLIIGGDTARKLNRTFSGVFAIFSIGWEVIKRLGGMFAGLFGKATKGSGGILDFTAKIGDFLIKVEHAVKTGDGLGKMFDKFQKKFAGPIHVLQDFAVFLNTVFKKIMDFSLIVQKYLQVVDDNGAKTGEGLKRTFDKIQQFLSGPIHLLQDFGVFLNTVFKKLIDFSRGVKDFIQGFDTGLVESGLERIKIRFEPITKLGEIMATVWNKIVDVFNKVYNVFKPIAKMVGDVLGKAFTSLGDTIKKALGKTDYNTVLDTVNTGLFAGLILLLKKFMKDGLKVGVSSDIGGGVFSSIKKSFDDLTGTMKAMQANLKAGTLMKIAIAIGILTISVVALSLIDSEALTKALIAMTVMFTQLMISMKVLEQGSTVKGSAKIAIMAGAMILLAIAVDLLAIAVSKLAKLSWQELAKGLVGVTALLAALVVVSKTMEGNNAKMISTGIGLMLLAVAIRILVSSVTELSGLSWEELAKGLVSVGVILGALTLFTKFAETNKGGISQGAGLILLAIAMKILASAMGDFAKFSWDEISRGLAAMSGGLGAIAIALKLIPPTAILSAGGVLIVALALSTIGKAIQQMGSIDGVVLAKGLGTMAIALGSIAGALALLPPTSLLSAAAIFIVASSLKLIVEALGSMGGMSWEEIGKGLLVLASSLAIIAITVTAMILALPGAVALAIIAGSLLLLAPVLMMFGAMSWEEITKGLAMLAGVFLVLGVAGLLLTPVIPTLLGLGIAIALLGIGMMAVGVGMLAFSVALTTLGASGAIGAAAIVTIVTALLSLIPLVVTELGKGVIALAKVITKAAPAILEAITTVLMSLLNAIIKLTPKICETLWVLITNLLDLLVKAVPKLVEAGIQMILGLLRGVVSHIGEIVKVSVDLIVGFIAGITQNIGRLITAGLDFLIAFLKGITSGLPRIMGSVIALFVAFIKGITDGLPDIIKSGVDLMVAFIKGIADGIGPLIKAGVDLIVAFVKGIAAGIDPIIDAGVDLMLAFIKGITKGVLKLVDAGAKLMIAFINGMANSIRGNTKPMIAAMDNLGKAMTDALVAGIKGFGKMVISIFTGMANAINENTKPLADATLKLGEAITNALVTGIKTFGKLITGIFNGMADAIRENTQPMIDATENLAGAIIDGLANAIRSGSKITKYAAEQLSDAILDSLHLPFRDNSPSKATYEIGENAVDGFTKGLTTLSGRASNAAEGVGFNAIDSMRKSISGISDVIDSDMDMHPTITPILDLSDVKNNAGSLGSMLSTNPIIVDAALSKVSSIATGYQPVPSSKTLQDMQALTASMAAKTMNAQDQVTPRPVEFHIGTVEDGDSLLRRARATNKMLSLAEGGDSSQMIGLGI